MTASELRIFGVFLGANISKGFLRREGALYCSTVLQQRNRLDCLLFANVGEIRKRARVAMPARIER